MPAYVIVDIRVTDPVRFEEYRKLVPPTISAFGGRYLARGGTVVPLEGDWDPERIVVLEFPTLERARAWWASAEYRLPRTIRGEAARTRMIAVESV